MDIWLSFASGDQGDLDGLAYWKPYEAEKRTTVVLDAESSIAHDPQSAERQAWAGIPDRVSCARTRQDIAA